MNIDKAVLKGNPKFLMETARHVMEEGGGGGGKNIHHNHEGIARENKI